MVSINCLQIQAKVVAVLEMVISALVFLFLLFLGITIAVKKEMLIDAMDKYPDETDHPQLRQLFEARLGEQIAIFLLPMLYCIGDFGLAIFLFRSVDQLNHKRLRLWLTITGTLLAISLLFFLVELLRKEEIVDVIVMTVITSGFSLYTMGIVWVLIKEIKASGVRHPVPYNNGFYKL